MGANIAEQRREIGVLLALGLSARALGRVYAHEAFALVVAACACGVAIGTFVAWSMGLQQALFTGIPLPIVVPWAVSAVIVVASVGAAFVSTALPLRALVHGKPITSLLR
jgi:ABC-type antimicrobial peptide transport system permease subunit